MYFIVDDGASKDEIRSLEKKCDKTELRVALGASPGIVHIKGIYVEFVKNSGRSRRKRRFFTDLPTQLKQPLVDLRLQS